MNAQPLRAVDLEPKQELQTDAVPNLDRRLRDFARSRITTPHFASAEALVAQLAPTDPIFCMRPAEIRRSAARFSAFPGRTLYAVKCNPHPLVLNTLYEAGIRDFDVASLGEVELVDSLFGKAAGMFYNNPAKARPAIRDASERHGIRFYTVDHQSELEKVLSEVRRPDDLIIAVRLSTSSKGSRYALSTKFGAECEQAVELLKAADQAGVRVGLSFHVGSQCLSPQAFTAALAACRDVVRRAGVQISVLNVGGGFPAPYPGDNPALLEHYLAAIIFGYNRLELAPGCLLLCEPGRSLVATGASVLTQVLLRKGQAIYLNDGIFGSLQELRHPKERRPTRLLRVNGPVTGKASDFRVYGPTCDSDDVLGATMELPCDVKEGDWIEIGMMGAYSLSTLTRFNGFSVDKVVTLDA